MAEAVPFSVAASIITMLGSSAFDRIGMIYGVKEDLKKLDSSLSTIKAALVDAEERQKKSQLVQEWIKKLKDVVYEAEDVLDAFATKALQRNLETDHAVKDQVREFFSSSNPVAFRIKMAYKVKDIRERMDEIAADMSQFNFIERTVTTQNREREQSHPFVSESDVFGRDKEKEEIIKLLTCSRTSQENLSVIAFVGIGGLGKTTLAQFVCNDDRVKQSFEPRMWVCVSEDFDVKMLVEKIIRSATNGEVGNLDMDQLQSRLRQIIREKRFLLVLDDVWSENDRRWDDLKKLLVGGAKGSSVIVTTRSRRVASVMGAENPYVLEGLTEEKSWELFQKLAFRGRQEKEHPGLTIIGKDIVKKCRGVPLAIRTLGSVLSNCEESEWLSIQENEIWMLPQADNDIMPVLRLSYEYLPSHLRQCFTYCSIFPKDFRISKQTLIQLWMAQGYIQSGEIGDRYFKDLFSRSFFQEAKEDDHGNIESCKMHDLIHDLAQTIVGTDCLIGKIGVERKISERVHHVSLLQAHGPEFLKQLLKAKRLRTILQVVYGYVWIDESSFHIVVSNFKSLRALDLSHLNMKTLPNSIGKLKHLRYLNLSLNWELKSLPNSVCNLHNLQTLNLTLCRALTELPPNIGKLINLVHLMIDGCYKLTHMPVGLGKLISLQLLQRFIVTDIDWRLIKTVGTLNKLKGLNHLRGELVLENLHNVRDAALESTEVNLKEKKYLQSLSLQWTSQIDDAQNCELLLDNLQPHPNLKELVVEGYEGTRFSGWLSSIIHLVSITIKGCEKCTHLPPLDQLPCLKFLTLGGMGALEYVDDGCRDFSSSSASALTTFFPSLTKLTLTWLPNLKGWTRSRKDFINEAMTNLHYCQGHFFPCLSQLDITDCPMLTSMPLLPNLKLLFLTHSSVEIIETPEFPKVYASTTSTSSSLALSLSSPFPKLETLCIQNVEDCVSLSEEGLSNLTSLKFLTIKTCPMLTSLSQGMRHLSALQQLEIHYCHNLTSLPEGMHLSALQQLEIHHCHNLTSLPEGMHLSALQQLEIYNCPSLTSLPEGMHLSALQQLKIHYCASLTSLPEGMHLSALQQLKIHYCPSLTSLPEGMHLSALQQLKIHDCHNLTSLPEGMHLSALQQLEIHDCPSLTSLPKGMHPSALQQLEIHDCPSLTSLPEGMHLSALQQLEIHDCPSLTSLPEGMHLSALQQLEIHNCPSLTSLPEGMHLSALQQLKFYYCHNLTSLLEGMHLTALQQLEISNCPNLTSLPEGMHLTALQQLEISNCPNLTSLPEGMHLTSLQKLVIRGCPRITERCEVGKEDWSKIAHVPVKYIG